MAKKPVKKASGRSSGKPAPRKPTEPKDTTGATRYAVEVLAGRILVGNPVKLACARHLSDIKNQKRTGLQWRPEAAQRAVDFIEQFCTVEVKNEVVPFKLLLFQAFIVGSLFGWFNPDDSRRFRNAYIEEAKGNGKTPIAAAIALYGLIADGQVSPEIYFAAVTREQANIGFRDAKAMAERSEEIKSLLDIREAALLFPERNGVLRAVSSEHRGLDGKRPHIVIVDELHEHPTGLVVDKMRAGTKNRTNAMIIRITNSGSDLESVCWHEHEYSMSVLEGKVKDPSWFGYICSLDKGDEWTDPACWEKTNPGLGTILPRAYLTEQVREAQGMPSKQNIVKRLNFCIWTQQHTLWIPIEQWERCKEKFDQAELEGEPCWVGLDLSDKLDLSTAVFVFKYPIEQEIAVKVGHRDEINPHEEVEAQVNIDFGIDILPFFFIPEETMHQREKEDRVPYSDWERNGFVIATPGQIIDYGYIYRTVLAMSKRFSIQQIGYDPRGATQLAIQLGEAGFEMVELTQGFNNMSEPAQIFEALVAAGRVRHNGHPVMTWNVQNSAVKHSKDNRMIIPYKSHARKRIDGVTGVCMALGRAMVAKSTGSVYESRGILRL